MYLNLKTIVHGIKNSYQIIEAFKHLGYDPGTEAFNYRDLNELVYPCFVWGSDYNKISVKSMDLFKRDSYSDCISVVNIDEICKPSFMERHNKGFEDET